MTAVAGKSRVLTLQDVAGLAVIEAAGRWSPLDKREVFPVVLGVTLGATLTRVGRQLVRSVQTAIGFQATGNFGVALETLQFALGADLVTGSAMGSAFQRLVRSGERTRRNLRAGSRRQEHGQYKDGPCRHNYR